MSALFKNMSWMMLAELFSRLSRFVTLFVLAAAFSNTDYGLAMLGLVIHELFRVFTKLGTGAKIIQCSDSILQSTLENASTLQWCVALATACVQIVCASWIAEFYAMPMLGDLLSIMALAHLCYPMVSTRIFEQQRQNQFRYYGLASGICIAFENLLIALMVFVTSSVEAIAWAKVAAAIFWVMLFIRLPTAQTKLRFDWSHQHNLIAFSFKTLTSELSRMLRFQADSLIAGRLLPPDIFGIYSFAKSAGLGIAQTFSQAYLASLYPYMCKQYRQSSNEHNQGIWWCTGAICGLFVLQALLAPFYIELLFGERWLVAVEVASALCLIAIPTLLIDHLGLAYRAQNMPLKEAKLILSCTLSLCAAYILIAPNTPMLVAIIGGSISAITCGAWFIWLKWHASVSHYKVTLS